jgi:hypothetical protein
MTSKNEGRISGLSMSFPAICQMIINAAMDSPVNKIFFMRLPCKKLILIVEF